MPLFPVVSAETPRRLREAMRLLSIRVRPAMHTWDSCVQSVGRKSQSAAEQLAVERPLASSHWTKTRVAGREFSTWEPRSCGG